MTGTNWCFGGNDMATPVSAMAMSWLHAAAAVVATF